MPPPVADAGLPYETSDTIMRLDRPPRRLAVLGGGYIAAELAHVFAAAGADIVMIEQADTLLGGQDETVTEEFTALLAKRYDLRLGRERRACRGEPGALRITLDDGTTVEADTLLVAVGRAPNGDRMDLDAAGIDSTTRAGSSSTPTRAPPPKGSGRWATCARRCRSSTSPTARPTSCGTTCATPTTS